MSNLPLKEIFKRYPQINDLAELSHFIHRDLSHFVYLQHASLDPQILLSVTNTDTRIQNAEKDKHLNALQFLSTSPSPFYF